MNPLPPAVRSEAVKLRVLVPGLASSSFARDAIAQWTGWRPNGLGQRVPSCGGRGVRRLQRPQETVGPVRRGTFLINGSCGTVVLELGTVLGAVQVSAGVGGSERGAPRLWGATAKFLSGLVLWAQRAATCGGLWCGRPGEAGAPPAWWRVRGPVVVLARVPQNSGWVESGRALGRIRQGG